MEGGDPLRPVASQLLQASERLSRPMRLAIVGQIKRGKSTLVNALLGEEIAAAGHLNSTFAVTEYRYADEQSVFVRFRDGTSDGPLSPAALEGLTVGNPAMVDQLREISKLEFTTPNDLLRTFQLVDTPGLGSMHLLDAQGTKDFLDVPAAEISLMRQTLAAIGLTAHDMHVDSARETEAADAVLYLLNRGLHEGDYATISPILASARGSVTPLRAFAVLNRCDQYWPPGRDLPGNPDPLTYDPMAAASKIAERYMAEPRTRRLFFTIVPVAGLVGIGARTLTAKEFGWLDDLRTVEPTILVRWLRDIARFAATEHVPGIPLPVAMRSQLTKRLGGWGIHLACSYLREDLGEEEVRERLVADSGVPRLRELIAGHFGNRTSVIKLDHGIRDVTAAINNCRLAIQQAGEQVPEAVDVIADRIQELRLSQYDAAADLSVLSAVYNQELTLREDEIAEILAVTGEYGRTWAARLGLPEDTPLPELGAAAERLAAKWVHRELDPTLNRATLGAARTVRRSYERIAERIKRLPKSRPAIGTDLTQSITSGIIHGNANVARINSLNVAAQFTSHLGTLPQSFENFVGRHVESENLLSVLRSGEPNVVVISGMGGSGKTALCLHVAPGEWPGGVAPPGSRRTRREGLPSPGSHRPT